MFSSTADKNRHPVFKALRIAGFVVLGLAAAALFALVFGFVLMYLWNWLMPGLFGLKAITYWQAFGILILAKLLFGSFGKHSPGHKDVHSRVDQKWHKWMGLPPHPEPYPHPPVPPDKWDEYRKFWETEGQAAFDTYLAKDKTGEKEA